jgi:predicted nuclease with RNAse H fold
MTVLLGMDCATQPAKTGLALGELKGGKLIIRRCGVGLRSTADVVLEWLDGAENVLFAFDAPLGWPIALGDELHRHQAGAALSAGSDALFRRAADDSIHRRLGKLPLEVGASWLARTAAAALRLLEEIRSLSGRPIPLAWTVDEPESWRVIEVYPAATRIAHGAEGGGGSVEGLSEALDWTAAQDAIACSADAGDACVCALAAADFLAGRAVGPDDFALARREGWIWAPDVSLGCPAEPSVPAEARDAIDCPACAKGLPRTPPRICPECGHIFGGTTWGGIDAHWKSRHHAVMPYEQFWASLCPEHRGRR